MQGRREEWRKSIHMAFGFFAFATPFFETWQCAAFLGAALLFNGVLLPRWGGRHLWRDRDHSHGLAVGMIAYPLVLLLLFLLLPLHREIAAGAWVLLAFGDGAASLAGTWWGTRRLSWNAGKSWSGFLAHWLVGGTALTALLWLFDRPESLPLAAVVAYLTALWSAWLESQPQVLDDNILVPPLNALLLFALLQSGDPSLLLMPFLIGAAINIAFGLLAWKLGAISPSGVVAGTLLGATIWASLGLGGFVLMFTFIFVGSAATRIGYRKKKREGVAEARGGRRGASNALANLTIPALAAVFASITPYSEIYTLAAIGALAAATADTLSSEIGQLFGGHPRLITTWRPVPIGTDGGVTLGGTLASVAGGLLIAFLGQALDFYGLRGTLIVACAGMVGGFVDSLLGATLERRHFLDNQGVNFLCTLAGALVGGLSAVLLTS